MKRVDLGLWNLESCSDRRQNGHLQELQRQIGASSVAEVVKRTVALMVALGRSGWSDAPLVASIISLLRR